jgi:hypothetical protein
MDRQRRQREKTRWGGGARDRPEQKTPERDADWPSASPPQRGAREQTCGDVDGELGRGKRVGVVVEFRAEKQHPKAECQKDRESVDCPFVSGVAVS